MKKFFLVASLFFYLYSYSQENMYVFLDSNNICNQIKYDTFFSASRKPMYIRAVLSFNYTSKDTFKSSGGGGISVRTTGLYPVKLFYCVYFDSIALRQELPVVFEGNFHQPVNNFIKTSKKKLLSKKIFDCNIIGASINAFRDFSKKASEDRAYIVFRHRNIHYLQKVKYIEPQAL